MKRRSYLATLTVGAGALTGCTTLGKTGNDNEGNQNKIKLDGVRVNNNSTEEKDITVLITINSDIEYWENISLEPDVRKYIEPPDYKYKSGVYRIFVKDGVGNQASTHSTEFFEDSSCYYINIKYIDGGIAFSQSLNSRICNN